MRIGFTRTACTNGTGASVSYLGLVVEVAMCSAASPVSPTGSAKLRYAAMCNRCSAMSKSNLLDLCSLEYRQPPFTWQCQASETVSEEPKAVAKRKQHPKRRAKPKEETEMEAVPAEACSCLHHNYW